ncbi:hypothetical protein [Streptomyces sp. CAU 1734]|uniref:hypothetical protein n=1 Tax=Streptomyces sp. CAU 1734 TaxID=3140360 RepID=UPI003260F813
MTATSYNVRVDYEADRPLPDETVSDLHDSLARNSGTVSVSPAGGLAVRIFLDADSPVDAGIRGVEYVQAALLRHEILRPARMTGFEVLSEEEFDRQLAEPLVPELAGLAEVARIAGVSKGRASQLRSELGPYFVQELASGPVYLASGVRTYAAEDRPTPGVRRTEIPLTPLERALLDTLAKAAEHTRTDFPSDEHRAAAGAIEGVAGNGHQVQFHPPQNDPGLTTALDTLVEHGLVRTRRIYKKESQAMAPGHEEDLIVTLTVKGRRHSGLDTSSVAARAAGPGHDS